VEKMQKIYKEMILTFGCIPISPTYILLADLEKSLIVEFPEYFVVFLRDVFARVKAFRKLMRNYYNLKPY
jgi:hypothetical protein